jgi:CDP-diglyceride synthetase
VARLLQAFFEIMLHRRGPESLPRSPFFFGLVLALYAPAFYFSLQFGTAKTPYPLVLVVVDTAIELAFIWSLLRAFGHESRFLQTATAILGTTLLLNLLAIPPALWYRSAPPPDPQAAVPELLLWMLIAWLIDVSGFVVARAVGRPYVLGVAIMLGYVLLVISFRATFFPATPIS